MTRHYIIPIFVPHFGCPHDCVFCNQKKITGLSTTMTPEDVENIINEHLDTFQEDSFIEVAFYGGSFTAIDFDVQTELLQVPYKYKTMGKIHEIRLSTRPDAIDDNILENLKKYGVNTIELGVQSLDQNVLNNSERGHSIEDVYNSSNLIKKHGFNLGLQMMIGLPGDNRQKSIYTCKEFIMLNPFCVRIYPTLVIKDTYLEQLYKDGNYNPLHLDEAIDISTTLLIMFYVKNINVIRVGLQPTENIQLGKDVVAGPFHPSFRQLVESNLYKVLLDYYFNKINLKSSNKTLTIYANQKVISSIAGQKSLNTKYWKERYGFSNVKIYKDNVDLKEIIITIDDFYDRINMHLLMDSYLNGNSLV